MIEIKPYMFREKTDTGQTKWKVIDKRGKISFYPIVELTQEKIRTTVGC